MTDATQILNESPSSIVCWLTGTDAMENVLVTSQGAATQTNAYSAFGEQAAPGSEGSVLGFNGQRRDPLNGHYHLGNGYRSYSPALMQFLAPDSLSPFGSGGLNPYAYCVGDPINRADPSGHMSWQAIVGIGLGIIALATAAFSMGTTALEAGGLITELISTGPEDSILGATLPTTSQTQKVISLASSLTSLSADATGMAAMAMPKSQVSNTLGWVSLGLGLISAAGAFIGLGFRLSLIKWSHREDFMQVNGAKISVPKKNIQEDIDAVGINKSNNIYYLSFTDEFGNKNVKFIPHQQLKFSHYYKNEEIQWWKFLEDNPLDERTSHSDSNYLEIPNRMRGNSTPSEIREGVFSTVAEIHTPPAVETPEVLEFKSNIMKAILNETG